MITIQDNELAKRIGNQVKKYNTNQFLREELESVQEISLRNVDFTGKSLNINFEQLSELKHLKFIYLQFIKVDDSLIEIINQFSELKELYFSQCNIIGNKKFDLQQLEKLTLLFCENVNLDIFNMPEQLKISTKIDEKFDLNKVPDKIKIKILSVNNADIKSFKYINDFSDLESLNIDGSKVDEKDILNILKNKIEVSHKTSELPIG